MIEARRYANEIRKPAIDLNYAPYFEELLRLEYYEGAKLDLIYNKLASIASKYKHNQDYCLISINNQIINLIIENSLTTDEWFNEAESRLDDNLNILDGVSDNHYLEVRMNIYMLYSEINLLKQNYYVASRFIKECQKIQSLIFPPEHSSRIKAQEIENRIWLNKMIRDIDVHTGLFA